MTHNDLKPYKRQAYVNYSEGWTKLILGNDELQIVFPFPNGQEAKKDFARDKFDLKDVQPAEICSTVVEIRSELKRLSSKLTAIYAEAEKTGNFQMYDSSVRRRTDEIAYEITNILNAGIIKSAH